ncbi:MAG: TadE/TadG family type IV pilus assembly protein [Pseudomonadota bacterium]
MPISPFKKNTRGNVAVITAVAMVPLCGVAGLSLDFHLTSNQILETQAVLDGAVLAAARVKQSGATEAEVEAALQAFYIAQRGDQGGHTCTPPTLTISASDEEIRSVVSCQQDTSLMQVLGQDAMTYTVESVAAYTVGMLDVAFMFDVSNSMRGNRIRDLRNAAGKAVDIILPPGAPQEIIDNTRVAMSAYGSTFDAGPYFQAVTNVPPTRTYYHTTHRDITAADLAPGSLFDEMHIGLYETDGSTLLSEIGDGAKILVTPSQLANMTAAITFNSTNTMDGQNKSMRLQLSGPVNANKNESVTPFSLYGDSGIDNLRGRPWSAGDYDLRIIVYDGMNQSGNRVFDEKISFTLLEEGNPIPTHRSYTLTSTCVFARDSAEAFTDAPPSAGHYFDHYSAWFVEQQSHPDGGEWKVGFNPNGERRERDSRCRTPSPLELTNKRPQLQSYLRGLQTDGYTAGHLGVGWSWYMISDLWDGVFDGTATPMPYGTENLTKAVVLMSDGEFNLAMHRSSLGSASDQARQLCDNMKAKDIEIYTIAFRAPARGEQLLEYCATNPQFYFDASNRAELENAYREIALYLSELRLSN